MPLWENFVGHTVEYGCHLVQNLIPTYLWNKFKLARPIKAKFPKDMISDYL